MGPIQILLVLLVVVGVVVRVPSSHSNHIGDIRIRVKRKTTILRVNGSMCAATYGFQVDPRHVQIKVIGQLSDRDRELRRNMKNDVVFTARFYCIVSFVVCIVLFDMFRFDRRKKIVIYHYMQNE